MPNEVLRKSGDCFLFADSTYAPALAANVLATAYTRVQHDFAGLANAASRQSTKADLGARRAPAFNVYAAIEFGTAPTAGSALEFYWAPSLSATAGTGNMGNTSGADGAYTSLAGGTDDAGVKRIQFIGQMSCEAVGSLVHLGYIGTFSPTTRYGSLIIKNECGQTLSSTKTSQGVLFEPVIDEVQ